MIRKILGFLPVGFWLIMLYFGGVDFMNPMNTGWHITDVPLNLWIWSGLAVLSGVLLCFDGMIPIGLIVGIIPYAYLTIMLLAKGGSNIFPRYPRISRHLPSVLHHLHRLLLHIQSRTR